MKKQSVRWWGRKAREGSDDLQSKGSAGLFPSLFSHHPSFRGFPASQHQPREAQAAARLVDEKVGTARLGHNCSEGRNQINKANLPASPSSASPCQPGASTASELQALHIYPSRRRARGGRRRRRRKAGGGGEAVSDSNEDFEANREAGSHRRAPRYYRSPARGGLSAAEEKTGRRSRSARVWWLELGQRKHERRGRVKSGRKRGETYQPARVLCVCQGPPGGLKLAFLEIAEESPPRVRWRDEVGEAT